MISWYEPSTHIAVCPTRTDGADELLVKLKQIGAEVLDELALPVDLGLRLFRVKFPAWLEYDGYCEEDDDYVFRDRLRVRVIVGTARRTAFYYVTFKTKYYARSSTATGSRAIVIDSENDSEIWSTSRGEANGWLVAESWLDANYPDWRNPMAYWTERQ